MQTELSHIFRKTVLENREVLCQHLRTKEAIRSYGKCLYPIYSKSTTNNVAAY